MVECKAKAGRVCDGAVFEEVKTNNPSLLRTNNPANLPKVTKVRIVVMPLLLLILQTTLLLKSRIDK